MAAGKTELYKFTGKAKWAKIYEPEEFRGSTNWKINIYLDDAEMAKRKKAGIQSKTYEDEDGTYVTFKRPQTKLIKGQQQIFSGPKVIDKDGKTLVEYKKNAAGNGFERVGEPVLIGNGSIVEASVSVYPTSMGNGQRLESVRIIDLIEYNPDNGGDFGDRIIVGGEKSADDGVKAPW